MEEKNKFRPDRFVTTSEFFHSLGIGKTKFYTLLKQKGLSPPGKLLSPEDQDYYRQQLGFPTFNDSTP